MQSSQPFTPISQQPVYQQLVTQLQKQQTTTQLTHNFLPWLQKSIPLVAHLGIQQLYWQPQQPLCLSMDINFNPLVNDKGTAFGGGVTGLATLLGWCWITLVRQATATEGPVVIKESNNKFSSPITSNFSLQCQAVYPEQLPDFLHQLKQHKKASLDLTITVELQAKTAFSYQGTYVALSANNSP